MVSIKMSEPRFKGLAGLIKIFGSPAEVVIFNPPPLMGGVRGNAVDLSIIDV